jgi:ATP-binding cassette subfamily B multidrug efflux pump
MKTKTLNKILHYVHGYWKDTILTWIFVLVESICEVLVAYFMQFLVNAINNIGSGSINEVYLYSGVIAGMAVFAALMGILAGYWAASASAGFGKNLRAAMYKFSTSSIVTRTTTDVTNVQNAFLMAIRAVLRAPFMMIFALIMCFVTQWTLAWIFFIIIPVVLFLLLFLAKKAHPLFVKIFNQYDNLNESVEEDVDGIRVVKSFNQEGAEKKSFNAVSQSIKTDFIHAEKILSFNSVIINGSVYLAILLISLFGAGRKRTDSRRLFDPHHLCDDDHDVADDGEHGVCHDHHLAEQRGAYRRDH